MSTPATTNRVPIATSGGRYRTITRMPRYVDPQTRYTVPSASQTCQVGARPPESAHDPAAADVATARSSDAFTPPSDHARPTDAVRAPTRAQGFAEQPGGRSR